MPIKNYNSKINIYYNIIKIYQINYLNKKIKNIIK